MNTAKFCGVCFGWAQTVDDIKELAKRWKKFNFKDDLLESYSKNTEEFSKILDDPATYFQSIKDKYDLPDAVIYNGKKCTIMLTNDEYHEYQWHLSLALMPDKPDESGRFYPCKMDDETVKVFADAFFSNWKEIDNPGSVKVIRHFIGND